MRYEDMAMGLYYLTLEYGSIRTGNERLFRLFKEMLEVSELNQSGDQGYKKDMSCFLSLFDVTGLNIRLNELHVAVWEDSGECRLVNLSPPESDEEAYKFINLPDPPGRTCRFCFIEEDEGKLEPCLDAMTHPRCKNAYMEWKRAANRHKEKHGKV